MLEKHLKKLLTAHRIGIPKQNATIGDLNDLLRKNGIFDTPTWRKVSYLADIRNICSHEKGVEPTREQVIELIDGINWLVKNAI